MPLSVQPDKATAKVINNKQYLIFIGHIFGFLPNIDNESFIDGDGTNKKQNIIQAISATTSYKENIITVYEDEEGNKFYEHPNPGNVSGTTFDGVISVSATTEMIMLPKMNPNYISSTEYIPRSERKEWATVGLLGKIRVRTAEPIIGKKISVNNQGLAINGDKYDILSTIRPHTQNQYGIVKIFFR